MLDWLTELIASVGSAIGDTFSFLGEQVSNAIWNTMLQWSYPDGDGDGAAVLIRRPPEGG